MKTITITDNTCFMTSKVGDIEYRHFKERQELVPETFEELKELCKELKKSSIKILTDTITHKEYVCIDTMINFYENGSIIEDYEYIMLAENRTPQQMWQIVKALVGG